jgi:hypothetical protein
MTLQELENGTEIVEHSVSVHSRAVRWGNDGVGLQFIPQDSMPAIKGLNPLAHGVDKKELERFLERIRKG